MSKKTELAAAVTATVAADVAPVVNPLSFSIIVKDADGKPTTLVDTLEQATVDALSEIVMHGTAADDCIAASFEMIVSDTFKTESAPFAGETVETLRERLFASSRFQFMARVIEMQHKLWPAYADAQAKVDSLAPKQGAKASLEHDVAKAGAKGLIEKIRGTCGHQSRSIIRRYADAFGVKLTAGDTKTQASARSVIEGMIGVLDGIATKPRGDQKLEAELVLYRAARQALRDVLAVKPATGTAADPFGLTEPTKAPANPERANGPVVTLTKAQIAELTK